MDHIEPDELAVLALDGHAPGPDVRDHLATCEQCGEEFDALARTVAIGRGGAADADDDLEAPPSSVWAGIHAGLGLSDDLADDPLVERAPALAAGADAVRGASGSEPVPAPIAEPSAHVPPRRRRTPAVAAGGAAPRRRRGRWLVAAAAAVTGLVVGVGLGLAVGGIAPEPEPEVVLATAELDAFPGWDTAGRAAVEEDASGQRTIVVDLEAQVPEGEVREVWLIRADASGLVSLGLMEGDSARLTVPPGIDLAEYPLVDVSAEPVDGDPGHSGDSIVRGELQLA
ncbi:anti-sigma factor [Agromyces sp. SYSU T0242]|uniref:anti-sigma factor n=1 Tax=Agromyces litoreus TaxID=3158561 RepID=UPI003390E0C9